MFRVAGYSPGTPKISAESWLRASAIWREMRQGCAEIFLGAVVNAVLLRDFCFVAHPEASMPPVAGTPGSTFFDVCRAFFPTDLVGCSNPLGHAR